MRRIERFFQQKKLNDLEVARYIIENLFVSEEQLTLAIDRTEWGFGDTWHNLLCISVLYDSTAIPLVIFPLERKGNSDHQQRLDLLDKLLSIIPFYRIKAILGDREFIGDAWFKGLEERCIPFVMRVRGNITIGKDDYIGRIDGLATSDAATSHGTVHIGTRKLALSTLSSGDGERVVVISSDVREPLTLYKQRWGIETGFKCLKTGGFNLEKTHLKKSDRLKMLVQICSISMTLSLIAVRGYEKNTVKKNTDFCKIHSSPTLNASS